MSVVSGDEVPGARQLVAPGIGLGFVTSQLGHDTVRIGRVHVIGIDETVIPAECVLTDDHAVEDVLVLGGKNVRDLPDLLAVCAVHRGAGSQRRIGDRQSKIHGARIKGRPPQLCTPGSDSCSAGMAGASSSGLPRRRALRQWPTTSWALACRHPVAGQRGWKYTVPSLISVTSPQIPVRPLMAALMTSPGWTRSSLIGMSRGGYRQGPMSRLPATLALPGEFVGEVGQALADRPGVPEAHRLPVADLTEQALAVAER